MLGLGFGLWLMLVTIFSGFFGAKFRKKVENLERDRAIRVAAGDEKLPVSVHHHSWLRIQISADPVEEQRLVVRHQFRIFADCSATLSG